MNRRLTPYYDNIPYAHLSDFFYVWLKRAVGDLYPASGHPETGETDKIEAEIDQNEAKTT